MVQCGDNFGGYGFVQIEWVVDSYGVIIDVQCIGVGKFNCCQVFWILNLNQCDIRVWIFVDDFSIKFMVIVQLNFNCGGVVYDVVVGYYIFFGGINDDVGVQCYKFLLLVVVRLIVLFVVLVKW